MGFFNKKKKLPEPSAPGFAELETSEEDILNSIPVSSNSKISEIREGNVKLPEEFPEHIKKKANVPDLPEDAETEEEMNSKKLPEIPGIVIKNINQDNPDNQGDQYYNREEKNDGHGIITPLKKELPKKMTLDLREAEEHPEKVSPRKIKQNDKIEKEEIDNSIRSVFIKIEDFNSITFAIQEIKNRVSMIDRDINEIRAIKSKQDSEILAWERELTEIKERLASVDGILKRNVHD